mgnify:FL=1
MIYLLQLIEIQSVSGSQTGGESKMSNIIFSATELDEQFSGEFKISKKEFEKILNGNRPLSNKDERLLQEDIKKFEALFKEAESRVVGWYTKKIVKDYHDEDFGYIYEIISISNDGEEKVNMAIKEGAIPLYSNSLVRLVNFNWSDWEDFSYKYSYYLGDTRVGQYTKYSGEHEEKNIYETLRRNSHSESVSMYHGPVTLSKMAVYYARYIHGIMQICQSYNAVITHS